jgi:hypothetical protein
MVTLTLGGIVQSSDSKILRVTDATTDWGDGGNTAISSISALTPYTLQFTITTSDGIVTVYDAIDLFEAFGPFTDETDLVFDITANLLISDSQALGTSDDELPDGWYEITYSFNGGTVVTATSQVVIDGVIRNKIYDKVLTIPDSHEFTLFSNSFNEWNNILFPLYYKGLFEGMLAEVSEARKDSILTIFSTLQRLLA